MSRVFRLLSVAGAAGLIALGIAACAASLPFHGFADQATLDQKDQYVLHESLGGALDPQNMAKDDQLYEHHKLAYNRMEEGYYQWGHKLYEMGYRDEYYVRDLAPQAFHHDLMNTYDHDISTGFEDARAEDPNAKK